ncbi:MAG: hypothetical protein SFX73_30040 [Kofleriaceae bacterium]|nr:hypothetical protein [Kofleriaceae bacterium]
MSSLRGIARSPGWQLVVAGALLALLFPGRSSGSIGMTILAGAFGVGVAMSWPHAPSWLRRPPSAVTAALVLTIVATGGLAVFWNALTVSPDWPAGDWGPQHAVLAGVTPSMPGFDLPVWNHAVGTGDAPLDLYPAFTYLVTGHLAQLFGLDLGHAQLIVAVLVHVTLAVATTAIAMHVAPKPIALVVGLLTLVDSGAIAHGGTVGLFRWALVHSAMSLAFATVAALGVLAALRRPRLGASLVIWIFTALATATHPAGLLAAAAAIVALAGVALLASDVPPRRAIIAIGHLCLGAALGAVVWMPLAERILLYGQHYPNTLRGPDRLLLDLLAAPSPVTAYAMLGYAGYFGILAGLWSRRAPVVFVCASALVLLLGLSDVVYLAFDLAPGQGVARLGTERLAALARPFVVAAGAYGISVFTGSAIRAWRDAPPRRRMIAAALIGIMAAALVRVLPTVWSVGAQRASGEANITSPDPEGRQLLTAWARTQMRDVGPERWGRALFEETTHEHFHLTAETGLPSFHMIWIPDLLLRERIEDSSPESLRRFNVRWVIAREKSPSLGDPATEKTFGTYRVRELAEWDGKFARIEKGTGEVKTSRLDDRAVEIEVTGTSAPVLVALGTGYYPRWRAHHERGAVEPVYAYPTIPDGRLHVVSAWVAPGRTTFTPDGPLPSDTKGRTLSLLAAIAAIAGIVVWSLARLRHRALRLLARVRTRIPRLASLALSIGLPLLLVGLVVRGCVESRGVTRAIELGSGLRASATVEARLPDEEWQTCDYSRVEGYFYCPGLLSATDGIVNTLNDAAPSWGFNTPGIVVTPELPGVQVRIRVDARLSGTYWIATSGDEATIAISGEPTHTVTRTVRDLGELGARTVEIAAEISGVTPWSFTMVREDTIIPPRPFLAAPPTEAPASVRAIR